MAEERQPKFEGKATVKLGGPTADEVWSLLEDFCSINKWRPGVDTCYQVEGVQGQPGLIRYCATTPMSSSKGDEKVIYWAREKLLSFDPIKRCFSYEMLENNAGFNSYVAMIKVLPVNDDDECKCQMEWSYTVDHLDGWTHEFLDFYVKSSLQGMAERLEKAIQATE
ncbi:uncharacterized protein LOC132284272 [Cornus florida]|uniref:uncharacterized protein LOC132284272 n=1 Tax=Cornus florida TaxID=4283 RepID=UPI002899ED8F|nr:uncharacterized protein LOC132284272 [Cornus florida]